MAMTPRTMAAARMGLGTVIPSAAVQFGSRGTYVYIVDANTQAAVRDVVVGPSDGEIQAILKGLEPGERVILEGIDRLREGRPVNVVGDDPAAGKKAGEAGKGGKGSGDPTKKRKKQTT